MVELEYGEMYDKFVDYLKSDKFYEAFQEDYGDDWHNNIEIFAKHYNLVYHLYVRKEYKRSGGVEVSGTGCKALAMMIAILFNKEPISQNDELIFASEYIEGNRMKTKCCDLMCKECMEEFYEYYPCYEDVDEGIYEYSDDESEEDTCLENII